VALPDVAIAGLRLYVARPGGAYAATAAASSQSGHGCPGQNA